MTSLVQSCVCQRVCLAIQLAADVPEAHLYTPIIAVFHLIKRFMQFLQPLEMRHSLAIRFDAIACNPVFHPLRHSFHQKTGIGSNLNVTQLLIGTANALNQRKSVCKRFNLRSGARLRYVSRQEFRRVVRRVRAEVDAIGSTRIRCAIAGTCAVDVYDHGRLVSFWSGPIDSLELELGDAFFCVVHDQVVAWYAVSASICAGYEEASDFFAVLVLHDAVCPYCRI